LSNQLLLFVVTPSMGSSVGNRLKLLKATRLSFHFLGFKAAIIFKTKITICNYGQFKF